MKEFLSIVIVCIAAWYMWQFGKWVNYKLAYESGVEQTVKELVKPNCLLQGGKSDEN